MKIYNEPTWYDGIKKENELIEKEKHLEEEISGYWEFSNIELGMVVRVIVGIFTLGLSEAVFKCIRMYKAKRSEIYGPPIVKSVSWYENNKKKRTWHDQSHSEEAQSQTQRNRNRSRRNRQLGSRAPSRYGLMYRNGMPTRFWV